MSLAHMMWANLRQKKGRTLFLLLTVIFSVATVTGLLSVSMSMRTEIGDTFDQIGANVLVVPGDTRQMGYAGIALPTVAAQRYLEESRLEDVYTIKDADSVAIVAPKLLSLLESEDGPVLAMGVRFPDEIRLRQWWRVKTSPAGEPFHGKDLKVDGAGVLLGAHVARSWQKGVGDTVRLEGQSFQVAGVIDEVGSEEDRAVWMDLGALQELVGKPGLISLVEIAALCNTCPIEEMVHQLSMTFPDWRVTAIKSAVEARTAVVDRFSRIAVALSAIIGVMGALVISITLLGSIKERTREIGVMRALGFRQGHIVMLFMLEGTVLGVAGGLTGILTGVSLARALGPLVMFLGSVEPWTLHMAGPSLAAAVALTLAASLVPALKAASLDPMEALRSL